MYINYSSARFVSAFLCLILAPVTIISSCPTQCMCNNGRVVCQQGISGIPVGIPVDVMALVLMGTSKEPNRIFTITEDALLPFTDLVELYLAHSQVQVIEFSAFHELKFLRRLRLNDNQITSFHTKTFNGLNNLSELYLSGNPVGTIEPGTFIGLKNLAKLYLSSMELKSLSDDLFTDLESLVLLDLNSNNLKSLSSKTFVPLKLLAFLDLSYNSLITIPQNMNSVFSNLQYLYLSGNRWHCNCHLAWFKTLPSGFLFDGSHYEVVCNSPASLQYHTIHHLPVADFKCFPPAAIDCKRKIHRATVGNNVTMGCTVQGDPTPEMWWITADNVKVTLTSGVVGNYVLLENGTLLVHDVQAVNGGVYSLRAINSEGSLELNLILNVTELSTAATTSDISTVLFETTSVTVGRATSVQAKHNVLNTTVSLSSAQASSSKEHVSFGDKTTVPQPSAPSVGTEEPDSSLVLGILIPLLLIILGLLLGIVVYKKILRKNKIGMSPSNGNTTIRNSCGNSLPNVPVGSSDIYV